LSRKSLKLDFPQARARRAQPIAFLDLFLFLHFVVDYVTAGDMIPARSKIALEDDRRRGGSAEAGDVISCASGMYRSPLPSGSSPCPPA
jgi:hypothetical protein